MKQESCIRMEIKVLISKTPEYTVQSIHFIFIPSIQLQSNSWAFCAKHAPNLERISGGEGMEFNMAAYGMFPVVSWICLVLMLIKRLF